MSVQKQAQVPEIGGSAGAHSPRKRWWKRTGDAGIHLSRDFQAHTLAIQDTPPSPFTRMVLWGLALLIIVLLIWSYVSHIPIMTSAPGKFVTSARTKVIQSLDTGTVSAILVKAGDVVKAGQTLVELSPEVDRSALVSRTHSLALDRPEEQRIKAELSGKVGMAPVSGETASMVSLESRLQQSELSHYRAQLADDQAQIQEAQANLAAGQATLDEYAQRAVLDRLPLRSVAGYGTERGRKARRPKEASRPASAGAGCRTGAICPGSNRFQQKALQGLAGYPEPGLRSFSQDSGR